MFITEVIVKGGAVLDYIILRVVSGMVTLPHTSIWDGRISNCEKNVDLSVNKRKI